MRLGLVAHWSFDEGAGIIAHDDSGNGYHGHLVGGQWKKTGFSMDSAGMSGTGGELLVAHNDIH